jgi:hypothetical protein
MDKCCDKCATYDGGIMHPPIGCHDKNCECHNPLQELIGKAGEIYDEEFGHDGEIWNGKKSSSDELEIHGFIATQIEQAYKQGVKDCIKQMPESPRGYIELDTKVFKQQFKTHFNL